jgi:hypothetical protein
MKELYSRQAYKGDTVIAMSQFVQLVFKVAKSFDVNLLPA